MKKLLLTAAMSLIVMCVFSQGFRYQYADYMWLNAPSVVTLEWNQHAAVFNYVSISTSLPHPTTWQLTEEIRHNMSVSYETEFILGITLVDYEPGINRFILVLEAPEPNFSSTTRRTSFPLTGSQWVTVIQKGRPQ